MVCPKFGAPQNPIVRQTSVSLTQVAILGSIPTSVQYFHIFSTHHLRSESNGAPDVQRWIRQSEGQKLPTEGSCVIVLTQATTGSCCDCKGLCSQNSVEPLSHKGPSQSQARFWNSAVELAASLDGADRFCPPTHWGLPAISQVWPCPSPRSTKRADASWLRRSYP